MKYKAKVGYLSLHKSSAVSLTEDLFFNCQGTFKNKQSWRFPVS